MKKLEWIGSSKRELLEFPLNIRKEMGHALYIAQEGGKHKNAKPLKGFIGSKVLEIVHDDGNGTYRTMYTVQFEELFTCCMLFRRSLKQALKRPNKIWN